MDAREFFLAHGYSPAAAGILAVDFDGTLYPRSDLFDAPKPMPGAVRAMKRLRHAGWRIVIFTSRLSDEYLNESGTTYEQHAEYVATLLNRDGIPFDEITGQKVPAERYIDDRAITFDPDKGWGPLSDWLVFSRAAE